MATAAFRSATRRDSISAAEDAGSATSGRTAAESGGGGSHRRSRSLSRFPPPTPSPEHAATPSSRFVNKVRGGGGSGGGGCFPEISLDDLADEFFRARAESEGDEEMEAGVVEGRGRLRFPAAERNSGRRSSTARYARETESSRHRGRSVSRPPAERGGSAAASNGSSAARRQRYASVDRRASLDRHRWCDSENDVEVSHRFDSRGMLKKSGRDNAQQNSFHKPTKVNQALRRSTSQTDLFRSRDSSSSHSSLTDDESQDAHSFQSRNAKTIRAVYAPEKEHAIGDEEANELYEAMRIEEIRAELEKVVRKAEPTKKATTTDTQPTLVVAEFRRSCTSKLEESEKRKQELLAQLAAEEQRGHELTKIVKELLPTPKKTANPDRQSRCRRGSNDRTRMSRRLTEEAERYFEDFLSNVDDTDFSSFDGERSDTSSTRREAALHTMVEPPPSLTKVASSPAESDGVFLPWLQWETSNDLQTSPCKTKTQGASAAFSNSNNTTSSHGSWSPGDHDSSAVSKDKLLSRFEDAVIRLSSCPDKIRSSSFHIDDYLHLERCDDLLFEQWRQRQRIDAGGLVLCSRSIIM